MLFLIDININFDIISNQVKYMGKSLQEMLERYKEAIKLGDAKTLNGLGDKFFECGDYENAKKCYEYSVKLGDAEALCSLGYLYNFGLGVKQDYLVAINCYERSAEKGEKVAYYNLATLYFMGSGVEKNHEKALCYYDKALDLGCLESLFWLGVLYVSGEVEVDYSKANEYFKRSIEEKIEVDESEYYINAISYIGGSTKVNYSLIFEDQIEKVNSDERLKTIYEMLKKGSKVVAYDSLKDLTLEILNNMPDDMIINIGNVKFVDADIHSDFYTVSELKMVFMRINEILSDIDRSQNEEDIFMQIYLKLGDAIMPPKIDYHNVCNLEFYDSSFFNLMSLCNGIGVCRGCTQVLKNLLDIVEIECEILVSKECEKNIRHMYNQVRINGRWYYCDLMFDSYTIIDYCLRSEQEFKKSNLYHSSYLMPEHEANEKYPDRIFLANRNCFKVFGVDLATKFKMLMSQFKQIDEIQKK